MLLKVVVRLLIMTVLTVRTSSVPAVSGKALHGFKEVKNFFHNDDDDN